MSDSLQALEDDTLLLTVNNRLAQEMLHRHARTRIDAGLKVWATPAILPWSAWLASQYEALLDSGHVDRVLLNPHQEMLLWEQVVRASPSGNSLLRPTAAARLARQTWRQLHDWRLTPESLADQPDEETRLFLDWARHFQALCRQTNSLTGAELGAPLIGALENGLIRPPRHIRLAGFDTLTPLQQQIQDALAEAGSEIRSWCEQQHPANVQTLALQDRQQEYLAAARWVQRRLAHNPNARLAIVSPCLREDRDELQRCLQQILDPRGYLSGQQSTLLFNISLGDPLADYPLAAHLLLALRLCLAAPLSLHEIGLLLRSPFIGGQADEWLPRALLDAQLRDHGRPVLTRRELLHQAQRQVETSAAYCPDLIRRLLALQEIVEGLPTTASPNDWAGHLLALSDTLGWPGDLPPDSNEYQQAQRVRRAISEFATLSRVRQHLDLAEAIHRFTQLCADTDFQPRRPRSPIQALGILEAAGLEFDGIWITGMDDLTWPPPAAPNPLLPSSLQRELDMPHASAERELHFARQLLQRLVQAAPEVLLSHPQRQDEQALRPSPLIAGFSGTDLQTLGLDDPNPLYAACREGATSMLPGVDHVPLAEIPSGGASLLTDQANCPFKAMAHHRLQARALPEPTHAPDPRLIGKMVHQLLERIWQHLRDSRTLHDTPAADLRQWVEGFARETLRELARQRPDLYSGDFSQLEEARLTELALAWLEYEAERARPFKVIACEKALETHIAGLPLRVKIDRIDELEDGSLVIIDYKTGSQVNTSSWTEQRPIEPQVPLYCISHANVSAGILAQVHRRTRRMRGLAREPGIAPGVSVLTPGQDIPDWEALLDHWRTQLKRLAKEILDGQARVEPRDRKACDFCDLPALCRVQFGGGDEEQDA